MAALSRTAPEGGSYVGGTDIAERRGDPTARLMAIGAIVVGLALLVIVVVGFLNNAGHLLLALGGLALMAGGGWVAITEQYPRRAVGAVVAAGGLLLLVLAVVLLATGLERVGGVLLFLVLFALLVLLARGAIRRELHERDAMRPRRIDPPKRPVLICNPWSGGGKVERFGLVGLAEELGVEVVMLDHGLDLEQLARDAIARGADCLGMAGGDGSQALVASVATEHGLPFVCVTAGTRNHFALDLGLDREDPRASLYAFRDAVERRIDYGTVNGRLFVNNVSLGIYATIVQQEGYREAKAETTKALLPELLGRAAEPFDLQFTEPDGTEVDGSYLIQVSNNPYVLGATLDAMQRRRLDTGTLGVVAVTGATSRDAAAVMALSALGQRRRSANWHEFTTTAFEVRSRSGTALVGVDGEALELPTPLQFTIHPKGLRVLVPEGNQTEAERRAARNVSVKDLLTIARGGTPALAGSGES